MSMEAIQKKVIETYNENIAYLKLNHLNLHKKIELFNIAIDIKQVNLNYDLHYENNYFDIINLNNNQFLYNQNSYDLSKEIINNMSFDATIDSFKTFYDTPTNDAMATNALESDIMISYSTGNSPIINFVNKNLPKNQNFKEIPKFIAFGVLLGFHLPILQEKINSKTMLIVEPNLEIFRLSLFTINYADLSKKSKLFFSIAENEFEFRQTFEIFYGEIFIFNHYLKFLNISNSINFYSKIIQNFLISQSHYMFSYDRSFLTLNRTNSYINEDFKILNLKHPDISKILNKPMLILGAGPSLQNKINFVKENRESFIIIAIYATLPILERNGIKPDIITQYDAQDSQVLNTLNKLRNKDFFNESIFIFASHVNKKLINNFPKEKIFIFQALFEIKENFGILTSPSIGELTYAITLILGAKEIYLLGIDLALDSETGDSHIEGHSGAGAFNDLKNLENSSEEQYTFRNNTILVKGNFLAQVKTVPVFKASIDAFAQFCQLYKNSSTKVYNLSNGAYLYDTVPLQIDSINFPHLTKFDINLTKEEIFKKLKNTSEISYSEFDINNFDLVLINVKKIKNEINTFLKNKYKNFLEYKNHLINLIQFILFEKHKCRDLQNIILNYCFHNLHHIFYLFDISEETNKKKFIYEVNKNLFTQINKIINTYVISVLYSHNESNVNRKKLDKFLKNYNINETLYLEPFFQEIVETSNKSIFLEYKKDSIGFFATNETLANKEFITYIKEIIQSFKLSKIKIFYFFDNQKNTSQQIFRKYLDKIEFVTPNNFDDIKNNIEIWFVTSSKTESENKINDLILNNCTNIYSCHFNENKYDVFLKNNEIKKLSNIENISLLKEIKENFILPNSNYFEFSNNLKEDVLNSVPIDNFLKGYIGFLATKENLEKNFIQNLSNIIVNFTNLKYSLFYFEEDDLTNYKKVFAKFIDRFNFVELKSIEDIINNCEVWVQASIKNQSFLYNRIYSYLNNYSLNIYPIVLDKKYIIQRKSVNYLENLIPNFNETSFVKTLNKELDLEKLQNINPEDSIGFLATDDNLEDLEFIKLMNILFEKDYDIRYKAFYFNDEQKHNMSNVFDKYISKIDFIKPNDIYDITKNISIYIHSNIPYKKTKSFNYHKVLQVLNKTKANIFKIHLFDEVKDTNHFFNSLRLIGDSKIDFEKSVISKIFKEDERYNELCFINSLNQPIDEESKDIYYPDGIGFLATKENLEDKEFMNYIKELFIRFPSINFYGYSFYENNGDFYNNILINKVDDLKKKVKILVVNNIKSNYDKIIHESYHTKMAVVGFAGPHYSEKLIEDFKIESIINIFKENNELFKLDSNHLEKYSNHIFLNSLFLTKGMDENLLNMLIQKQTLKEWQFNMINIALKNLDFLEKMNFLRKKIQNLLKSKNK
jgi:hypothetical protein